MNIRSKIFGNGAAEELPVLKAKKPKGAKADTLNSIPVIREETRRGDTRDQDRHRLPDEEVALTHAAPRIRSSWSICRAAARWSRRISSRRCGTGSSFTWARTAPSNARCAGSRAAGSASSSPTRPGSIARPTSRPPCCATSSPAPSPISSSTARPKPASRPRLEDGEQRTDGRHPLIWSGTIHHDFQSSPVRLRNISETGAMVECSATLLVGAEPLLELGDGVSIFTTVAWVVGDSAGLKFQQPFDLALLATREARGCAGALGARRLISRPEPRRIRPGPTNGAASRCPSSSRISKASGSARSRFSLRESGSSSWFRASATKRSARAALSSEM